ncbi:hypothetical protein BH10CYA1_BH10CYA1_04470 [soil metagenome]
MTSSNSSDSDRKHSVDDEQNGSDVVPPANQNPQKSNKQVELDFCLFEKGPKAAKRFNDLIAKTLKLQE